jgi:hypothetical protein
MKGSAAYLEEPELRTLCGELEKSADCADWAAIAAGLPGLRSMLAGVAQTVQPE